jgi:hypothetical protein
VGQLWDASAPAVAGAVAVLGEWPSRRAEHSPAQGTSKLNKAFGTTVDIEAAEAWENVRLGLAPHVAQILLRA